MRHDAYTVTAQTRDEFRTAGFECERRQNYATAQRCYEEALRLHHSDRSMIFFRLAYCHRMQGSYSEAYGAYKHCLAAGGDENPEMQFTVALFLQLEGTGVQDLNLAEEHFMEAVRMDPVNNAAYQLLFSSSMPQGGADSGLELEVNEQGSHPILVDEMETVHNDIEDG